MYHPGRENLNVDALSHHPLLPSPIVGIAEDEMQVSRISTNGRGDNGHGEPLLDGDWLLLQSLMEESLIPSLVADSRKRPPSPQKTLMEVVSPRE
jgi:hypothetical protein